jgi:hypothetical protein
VLDSLGLQKFWCALTAHYAAANPYHSCRYYIYLPPAQAKLLKLPLFKEHCDGESPTEFASEGLPTLTTLSSKDGEQQQGMAGADRALHCVGADCVVLMRYYSREGVKITEYEMTVRKQALGCTFVSLSAAFVYI